MWSIYAEQGALVSMLVGNDGLSNLEVLAQTSMETHPHTHRKICSTKLMYKYNNSNNNNHNHNNNSNNNIHNHNNNNHNHNKKIIMMMIIIIFHLWIHGVTYMASHIQAHTIRVSVIILHVM